VDKTQLPKEELNKQIQAEKQEQKSTGAFSQVLNDIPGDHPLKKVDVKEKNLANLSKEELIALINAEREAYKAEEASNRAAVLGDLAEGAKKLKKTETKDKSKKKKKDLAKEIQDEKEAMAIDSAHEKVLADVTKDHKLQKTTTVDKSQVSKEELKKQIKSEKQEQKREGDFNQVLNDIQGDHTLKKVDMKEKNLANLSKEELIALIKAERDAFKAEEASNRAAVLGDIAEGAKKLKKTETKDKSKKKKKDLAKEIQDEKDALAVDSAHEKVLADVTKDHKLQKTTTVDKSKVSKEELKKQIQAEKQEQKREGDYNQVLSDIQEGDYRLKKADVKEKNLANLSKEELIALINAEREAFKAEEASNRAAVLEDIVEGAKKLKKNRDQR